ncbi:MAG: glycosyltransferase family 2 protein [Bacteroidota bacterium]
MKLSAIIVNYNSWGDTIELVNQALASKVVIDGSCELLIVDNQSTISPPVDRSTHHALQWIDRSENGGFSAGVNEGAKHATGDWLLLLNPDIKLKPDNLEKALQLATHYDEHTDQKIGVLGCELLNGDGSHQPSVGSFPSFSRIAKELFMPQNRRRYDSLDPSAPRNCDWVTGAFMLIRKKTFVDVNGFDEQYFLYFEETDFCLRAARAGWICRYDPSLQVCHQNPLQNRSTPPHIRVYTRHSRMLYFEKNRPRWEGKLMASAIWIESLFRELLNRLRGNFPYANAWNAIRSLAMAFLIGHFPVGTKVRDLVVQSNPKG